MFGSVRPTRVPYIGRAKLPAGKDHTDPVVDTNGNELKGGVGQICPICDHPIERGQAVRKRVDGSYQHEDCPPH